MTRPELSVIVPAHQCAPVLERCLEALRASDLQREAWELIVADDGSADDTPAVASRLADRVVRVTDGPRGPAFARNSGAEAAAGEVLVFVDSDVCVAPDALRRFRESFADDEDLSAVFGAYDLTPEADGFVSQYRNLLHHYVHAASSGPAVTFWAGCGAVRKAAFRAAGGFDERRYPRPQIEDVELGYRLARQGGRILLRPDIQGKHLKRWTWRGGLITDFRDRAVPWMTLLLERREAIAGGPLNVQAREKLLTALTGTALAALPVGLVARSSAVLIAATLALGAVVAANAPLLRWFARVRGWRFALRAIPLRLQYYVVNACAVARATWAYLRGRTESFTLRETPPVSTNRHPLTPVAHAFRPGANRGVPTRAGSAGAPPPPTEPSPSAEERLELTVQLAFAPLHKVAFGTAVAVAASVMLLGLTLAGLWLDPEGRFGLHLLSVYLYGYTVSPVGALVGGAWGAALGFVAGWFLAFCRNLVLAVWLLVVRARAELHANRDFLDHL
jgi:hypothetical protein